MKKKSAKENTMKEATTKGSKTPPANDRIRMKNFEQYGDPTLIPDKPKKEFN